MPSGFEKISVDRAKEISRKNGLRPAKVIGTDILRFIKKTGGKFEEINWDEFESILNDHNLAIYLWKDWMKIMKEK